MEDQTRFGRRSPAVVTGWGAALAAMALALLTLVACAPEWHQAQAVRPDERTPMTYCETSRKDTEPRGHVINYVDPELCGRYVLDRSDTTVRVPPIDRPSTQRAR